jgi:hypothetical protein
LLHFGCTHIGTIAIYRRILCTTWMTPASAMTPLRVSVKTRFPHITPVTGYLVVWCHTVTNEYQTVELLKIYTHAKTTLTYWGMNTKQWNS